MKLFANLSSVFKPFSNSHYALRQRLEGFHMQLLPGLSHAVNITKSQTHLWSAARFRLFNLLTLKHFF